MCCYQLNSYNDNDNRHQLYKGQLWACDFSESLYLSELSAGVTDMLFLL